MNAFSNLSECLVSSTSLGLDNVANLFDEFTLYRRSAHHIRSPKGMPGDLSKCCSTAPNHKSWFLGFDYDLTS